MPSKEVHAVWVSSCRCAGRRYGARVLVGRMAFVELLFEPTFSFRDFLISMFSLLFFLSGMGIAMQDATTDA